MYIEKKALAIMATYNGENFIREAIESIPKKCDLLISDDGSTDGTLKYLNSIENRHVSILNYSSGGKPALNFGNAINNTPSNYNYYFLADQDDIWTNEKYRLLIGEIEKIEKQYGEECPILLFGDSIIVDSTLKVINESFFEYDGLDANILINKRNVFFQNIAQGATMIFNKALLERCRPMPKEIYMHDWWLLLCALNFGEVRVSKYKTLLYRQHENNNIGANKRNLIKQLFSQIAKKSKIKNHLKKINQQTECFANIYRSQLHCDKTIKFLTDFFCISHSKNTLCRKFFLFKNRIYLSSLKRTIVLYLYF